MKDAAEKAAEGLTALRRRIGIHEGDRPGPLVICVGGIHGNEGGGVEAARRVLARLAADRPDIAGRFVALAGNVAALGAGRRYVDADLNRHWIDPQGFRWDPSVPADPSVSEDRERRELLSALLEEVGRAGGPIYFLDLHTSSAEGPPFVTVGDTLRNRDFAFRLGLPVVLGLEEQIDGALLEYVNTMGHVTVGVEGGRHDLPTSIERLEALLWLSLVAAGCAREENLPEIARHRSLLAEATPGIPHIVEVRHRHVVRPEDRFEMNPGYGNFHALEAGEVVARDRSGPIRVRESGAILLPLYQAQGSDGFFTIREVRPFWLRLSRILRRWRAPGLAALLPGVRRHPRLERTMLVDTRIARFVPLQVFHLLGYRKLRRRGTLLVVTRRPHDPAAAGRGA